MVESKQTHFDKLRCHIRRNDAQKRLLGKLVALNKSGGHVVGHHDPAVAIPHQQVTDEPAMPTKDRAILRKIQARRETLLPLIERAVFKLFGAIGGLDVVLVKRHDLGGKTYAQQRAELWKRRHRTLGEHLLVLKST